MIKYQDLDILQVKSNAIIVHGVNCLGKMGRGLALDVKKKFPVIYEDYRAICARYRQDEILKDLLGTFSLYVLDEDSDLYFGNLFTQLTISRTERVACELAIHDSLFDVADWIDGMEAHEIEIYMPRIGCSNGGLNWEIDVLPVVELVDKAFDSKVIFNVCQPPKN